MDSVQKRAAGVTANGTPYIKSTRKSHRVLTQYERECVMVQRSKITYNLENLKTPRG